ncbi:bacillithiol system redox-active protein YtxJ [Radiobacillus deserti]|uniref:Bacillithiol system redox-active protein YtxJ n=1 Tax=Radiobacillus deserti TaxID=2594883 RepID=A0A516KHN4_9BACI|nr:bacillithiol system redox-active protein YtxJ [Radiobacillus deserti]QDP40897.1 bacillithiol system redox-active protein YtxJ [Radiobacillus deserti]
MKLIQSKQAFDQLIQDETIFFLLKHSLTCPISVRVKSDYDAFVSEAEVPLYLLHVQEARELSNYIAEAFDVKHESPQVLAFSNQAVIWHDSHQQITYNVLKEKEKQIKDEHMDSPKMIFRLLGNP